MESYVKAFQYKVINSILYTNTKLFKFGYKTNMNTICIVPNEKYYLFHHIGVCTTISLKCSQHKQYGEFISDLIWKTLKHATRALTNTPNPVTLRVPSLQLMDGAFCSTKVNPAQWLFRTADFSEDSQNLTLSN